MSSWKKASKVNQKVHRERHQPAARAHLGLLEKHKDYVPRARDYQRKQKTLKKLGEYALNRNPDEYYHHMVNSKLFNDRHTEKKKPVTEDTLEQRKLMENKGLSYVNLKLNVERRKAEKLQSQLHLIDIPSNNTHKKIVIRENKKKLLPEIEYVDYSDSDNELPEQVTKSLPHINVLANAHKRKEQNYKRLMKALERTKKLSVIKEKMEVEQQLKNSKGVSKPKLIEPGTKTKAPVFLWKYQRKK